jgi:hypothetical protein
VFNLKPSAHIRAAPKENYEDTPAQQYSGAENYGSKL